MTEFESAVLILLTLIATMVSAMAVKMFWGKR
jgi:hypothetical protein